MIIINYSSVKCASYFLTLEQHDDQDRIVTVIIVQVPDTFAQEALASTPPLTRRPSTKILYPLYFWPLSNECKIFLTPRERSNQLISFEKHVFRKISLRLNTSSHSKSAFIEVLADIREKPLIISQWNNFFFFFSRKPADNALKFLTQSCREL